MLSKEGNSKIDITSTTLYKQKGLEKLSLLYLANSIFHFAKTHSHRDFIDNIDNLDAGSYKKDGSCMWKRNWKKDYNSMPFGQTGIPNVSK